MPDLIPATPEVLIVHPHGLAILNDLLDHDRYRSHLPVTLPQMPMWAERPALLN